MSQFLLNPIEPCQLRRRSLKIEGGLFAACGKISISSIRFAPKNRISSVATFGSRISFASTHPRLIISVKKLDDNDEKYPLFRCELSENYR